MGGFSLRVGSLSWAPRATPGCAGLPSEEALSAPIGVTVAETEE